ncbi:MAG: tRNA preQ1(34) S-adenosylmethionine ribosyltransferase-isomerase QueA [Acidimicrobiales bacterium]|nr:tRNA preQ1(34) S-adenosylmethionine ribosyltransferase-isomerase QueA [Acidimicrobiales bacterium]
MDTSALDYPLPDAAIAQRPVEPRDAARLLVDRGPDEAPGHRTVADLPDLLLPGDLVVVNDSRVIPARLRLRKVTGGTVEVLLLERHPEGWWEGLVRPSRKVAPGSLLTPAGGGDLVVEVGGVLSDDGRRRIELRVPEEFTGASAGTDRNDYGAIARHGEVPLPPYIHEPLADVDRYQTVYADRPGSVAAPTAGLHLTESVIAGLTDRGIDVVKLDLKVGLGTFRPVTTARVEDHPMHAERYVIPVETARAVSLQRERGGRVVAVGTTVVRALESWAKTGETEAATDLFIHGDHDFRVVDVLLTNFHVPRSSLLALVESFVGQRWRHLYATALDEGYRFLSFGDAMLLTRALSGAAGERSVR